MSRLPQDCRNLAAIIKWEKAQERKQLTVIGFMFLASGFIQGLLGA